MSVKIELDGVDQLMKKLEQLGNKGNKAMAKALQVGAEPILQEMKNSTILKDRTGNLRKSLKVSKVRTRAGRGLMFNESSKYIWIGDVDRKAGYSWYVEYGSSRHVAKPFMRDAWARRKREAQDRIKEELRKELSKIE